MELTDLYTADRIPTGKAIERNQATPEGNYRLTVHICVFNSAGEMLIQQRQPFKAGWSDIWDVSAGGSAISGETSAMTAERELFEEIGIQQSFKNTRPMITIHYDEGFDDIYTIERDIDISELKLQYEEVQAAKWATADEILKMIDDGVFIPFHKHLIKLLFDIRNHRGTFIRDDNNTYSVYA